VQHSEGHKWSPAGSITEVNSKQYSLWSWMVGR
jgi:hypothetical protein